MPNEQADIKSDINLTQIHSELVRPLSLAELRRIEIPPPCPESMSPEEYQTIAAFTYF